MAMGSLHYPRTRQPGLLDLSDVEYLPHLGRQQMNEVQLQFNRDVVTQPTNLAAKFSNPCPIIIEKLRTPQQHSGDNIQEQGNLGNSFSSVSFSVVSEESLNLAVQLAKRDMKQNHFREKRLMKSSLERHIESPQFKKEMLSHVPEKDKTKRQTKKESKRPKNASKSEVTRSGALVYVYTPDKNRMLPIMSDSPPTLDPGPDTKSNPRTKVEMNEQEVIRLQKELHTYMQKIEELARKECPVNVLDPDEEARGRVRQQERAARSARMLYVLRQQVKEIQDDLEQLSPQKIRHTKKSHTMSRLAAVHRGAIRALQMFVTQLSERSDQQVPTVYKELGHLIRQLSLCTAKVETGSDPATSNLIISILQQVEDLDTLLEAKMSSHIRKSTSRSPSRRERPNNEPQTGSPKRYKKCPPPVFKQREPQEEKWAGVRRKLDVDKPTESLNTATQTEPRIAEDPPTPERRAALRSGLEALIQAGGLKGLNRTVVGKGQHRSKGVLLPQRPQGFRQPHRKEPSQRAHFQEKTVAFMLKENRPPVREKKTPWVPTNPTSPPASPKRVNWDREKKIDSPPKKYDNEDIPRITEPDKELAVADEAVRLAWLDSETARRMQELDNLYRNEISCLQNLREETVSLSRLPIGDFPGNQTTKKNYEEPDQWSRERYSGQFVQDNHELEIMIQRMEEMERYQDSVRQRFNQIVYADPEFWAQEEKEKASAAIHQRPQSPHPIRITKSENQREPVVDIVLEEPFAGDSLQISKEDLALGSPHHFPLKRIVQTEGKLLLSVPTNMLRSIWNYSDHFERHLRLTSHEEIGNFNPWHISESLAEELMEEALEEVAAELQEACEGYAEAVFTSEFLEPK
ncbi:protein moonraker [Discoglossus pictus]